MNAILSYSVNNKKFKYERIIKKALFSSLTICKSMDTKQTNDRGKYDLSKLYVLKR